MVLLTQRAVPATEKGLVLPSQIVVEGVVVGVGVFVVVVGVGVVVVVVVVSVGVFVVVVGMGVVVVVVVVRTKPVSIAYTFLSSDPT